MRKGPSGPRSEKDGTGRARARRYHWGELLRPPGNAGEEPDGESEATRVGRGACEAAGGECGSVFTRIRTISSRRVAQTPASLEPCLHRVRSGAGQRSRGRNRAAQAPFAYTWARPYPLEHSRARSRRLRVHISGAGGSTRSQSVGGPCSSGPGSSEPRLSTRRHSNAASPGPAARTVARSQRRSVASPKQSPDASWTAEPRLRGTAWAADAAASRWMPDATPCQANGEAVGTGRAQGGTGGTPEGMS